MFSTQANFVCTRTPLRAATSACLSCRRREISVSELGLVPRGDSLTLKAALHNRLASAAPTGSPSTASWSGLIAVCFALARNSCVIFNAPTSPVRLSAGLGVLWSNSESNRTFLFHYVFSRKVDSSGNCTRINYNIRCVVSRFARAVVKVALMRYRAGRLLLITRTKRLPLWWTYHLLSLSFLSLRSVLNLHCSCYFYFFLRGNICNRSGP